MQTKYLMLIVGIAIWSVVIWALFIPAPFTWILMWVVSLNIYAYIRMAPNPKVTKILGDLKTAAMFSLKSFLCVTLFFILRAYLTQLIDFTPFQVWTQFSFSSGAKSFINYPAGKIIYEMLFLLGVGWVVIEAVFKKSQKYIYGIATFLLIAFTAQTVVYARYNGSQTAQALSAPMTDENVANKIANDGAVGGSYRLTKEVLFGPEKPAPTPPPRNVGWQTIRILDNGKRIYVMTVYEGDEFEYISPQPFKTVHVDGINDESEGFHNKSSTPREVRYFHFYNAPPTGSKLYLVAIDSEDFEIKFRVNSHQ